MFKVNTSTCSHTCIQQESGQEKGTSVDLKLESEFKEGMGNSGEWVSLSLRPDIIKNV